MNRLWYCAPQVTTNKSSSRWPCCRHEKPNSKSSSKFQTPQRANEQHAHLHRLSCAQRPQPWKNQTQQQQRQPPAWLKKERVFIEADHLGIDRPVTIGHFTKIAAPITHLANFHDYLVNQLMLVEIEADKAVELAPHLKQEQINAMTNGDDFIPILPAFEIYRTHLSHGRAPSQVKTDVLGVKCAQRDAKLLGEFFTRMASETTNDQCDGVFIPKGAVHLLGPQTYEQVLKDNIFFLTTVATIPINLTYNAWFAVIEATPQKVALSLSTTISFVNRGF